MPDERVQAAIANWAPRFIAQGVDYNDFFRTTARIEKWDDWCREWCAAGDVHYALAAKAEARDNWLSAGEAYISAALCYHFGKFLFQDHYDEYLAAGRQSVDAYARGLKLLDPAAERLEIPLDNAVMVGYLRRPPGAAGASTSPARPACPPGEAEGAGPRDEAKGVARHPSPRAPQGRVGPAGSGAPGASLTPLVVLLPGLDSVKEEFFYWEEVFLRRGLATFSLDGPGQGECGYHSHIRPDYEAAVSAALDVLVKRSDIDSRQIGLAGVSLGGYYAPRAAAFEPRVRAVVGNCGPWDFGECWPHLPALTRAAFGHHSGAKDEAQALANAHRLSLDGVAHRIKQPLLVIHGRLDRIIPWEQGHKIASAAGSNAELAMFENGNHVCNNIPYVYRPLTADWLKEKLG